MRLEQFVLVRGSGCAYEAYIDRQRDAHAERKAREAAKESSPPKVPAPKKPRRAKREAFFRTPEWRALRRQVVLECGDSCDECGAAGSTNVDHVLPLSKFPALGLLRLNLRVLCRVCNFKKSALVDRELAARFGLLEYLD